MEPLGKRGDDAHRRTAWLSRPLQALVAAPVEFDVLIVGSGYGGAVSAMALAGAREAGRALRIGLLERGAEYLPGRFPSRFAELAGHVRFSTPEGDAPRGNRDGLFDVRLGPDVTAIVANGVGGGSLINAGVMLRAEAGVLSEPCWPRPIVADGFGPWYDEVERLLGAVKDGHANVVAGTPFAKAAALASIGARGGVQAVPLTVSLDGAPSSAGVAMEPCQGCGDCATGCNHGAKESLDTNLLVQARRGGVEIYTGATVLHVARRGGGWQVFVVHTDAKLRRRQGPPFAIVARRVVLAAGCFGSTEILARSRAAGLTVSSELGRRFSANGDLFAVAYGLQRTVGAVARESEPAQRRAVGPTITSALDRRADDGLLIQELAVPAALRRVFAELFTTARALQGAARRDAGVHSARDPDRCAIDDDAIDRTLPLALIGRDSAEGVLRFHGDGSGDGSVVVEWPALRHDPRWDAHHDRFARAMLRAGIGGELLANPAWRPLAPPLATNLGIGRGALLTVHPLGGCPMADDAAGGVVDHLGRVFDGAGGVHEGLVVLDGAIVPTSLGVNPALTIAALALRATARLRDDIWKLDRGPPPVVRDEPRPRFAAPPEVAAAAPTRVQVVERLIGTGTLPDGRRGEVELTLHSRPVALQALMAPLGPRRIEFDDTQSTLVVRSGGQTLARAAVTGTLSLFERVPGTAVGRVVRALPAWFAHRGWRDMLQALGERLSGQGAGAGLRQTIGTILDVATRAGAALDLRYELRARPADAWPAAFGAQTRLAGVKRLRYDGRTSPWQQLAQVTLERAPGLRTPLVLHWDLKYVEACGVPLLRIVEQQDHPSAIADLASFGLYVLRHVLDTHLWSFRRPDPPSPGTPQRLPGAVPHLPPPQVHEHVVGRDGDGEPVRIRLTRYRPPAPAPGLPPVLLVHGYSASGTTFAHPTLKPGLAGALCNAGRDVWIVDLRSSCGLPTGARPWCFEDMAFTDLPLAVDHICRATGSEQVDALAHCMGAAMLTMALLADRTPLESDAGWALRELLRGRWQIGLDAEGRDRPQGTAAAQRLAPGRLRRLVLSQVGPLVVMTPANRARAQLARYIKQFFPVARYEFSPADSGSLLDQAIDRLLATLPYPADEFRAENPLWPPGATAPWSRTRRRIDILYGRVFKLNNLSRATLDRLDDFFGPMNVDTLTQAIHFARSRSITDAQGRNMYATLPQLARWLDFPMLSIHGEENGLADPATAKLLRAALDPARFEARTYRGFGHQDCLIGRDCARIFGDVVGFLGEPG